MRKVIHKIFWAWEFEKEEEWLNRMAAKGLALIATGLFKYEFDECLPGEYSIRLELLENHRNHVESQKYISFLEEIGVEHVGGIIRWAYFRKKTVEGPFDLFSDIASRIKQYTLIIQILAIGGFVNLYVGCYNLIIFFTKYNNYSNINIIGIINIVIAIIVARGCWIINKKRRRLKEEQQIYE